MPTPIAFQINGKRVRAELNDSQAALKLLRALPLTMRMSRWGEEYYGDCGVRIAGDSSARELLEPGEVAYWPPGSALCLFFGPTPASTDERPRAASPVIPLGRITDDLNLLRGLGASVSLTVSRV